MGKNRSGKFLEIMGGIQGAINGGMSGVNNVSSNVYDDVIYQPSTSDSWFNKNTWFLPTLGISAVVLFVLNKK
tara:strand:+ start:404 stop:622 length:219 start_codon:yes stop_codon:yes gene_type:complete